MADTGMAATEIQVILDSPETGATELKDIPSKQETQVKVPESPEDEPFSFQ